MDQSNFLNGCMFIHHLDVEALLLQEWFHCSGWTVFFIHVKIYILYLFQDKALKGLTKPRFYGEKNNWYWLAVGATSLEGLLKP